MNSAPQATPPTRRLLSVPPPPTSPGNPSHVAPLFLLEIWGASDHSDQHPLWVAWAVSS